MMIFNKPRLALIMVFAIVSMMTVMGCGGSDSKQTGSDISGTVKVAGSTSVQPLAEELAEAFMDINPDINVSVQGGGSSAGIESAKTGTAQIGTSSRPLKSEEKGYGLKETVIANDGITVIVNSANPLNELTLDQIKKIFSGEINDWSQIGGKKGPITVVVREEGSGTRGAFEDIVMGKDSRIVYSAVVQPNTGAIKTSVSKDENAVGFISLGSVDSAVKAVKVDGVEPSESTVLDGSYKISRAFLFLTKEQNDAATQAFIDFVLSAEGQEIVSENYIKVK